MAKVYKRNKTRYPGVYYIEGTAVTSGKKEKIFYIFYRKNGKQIEEKVGRQFQDNMTQAKAARIRADRIEGRQLSNKEKRQAEEEAGKWTFNKIWRAYKTDKGEYKNFKTDQSFYSKHLAENFGDKEPEKIIPLDIDRLKRELAKKKKLKPQTMKHIVSLLVRLNNYAIKKNLCPGFGFHVELPKVDNLKTEDLNQEQLHRLLQVLEEEPNAQAKNFMKMVLFTGMRRGELFNLKWSDIDFNNGFILIREPKGGKSQKIPMNEEAEEILVGHEKPYPESPYVFPGRGGNKRVEIKRQVNRIKQKAGLPKDFRPLHGLRHVYASMLASSGQVDLYTLQKLLTHKSPQMTQRYAHLRDETLKRASDLAGNIVGELLNRKEESQVVNLEKYKK